MFHVELRQFPHVTRAFNLTREELDARVLRPWTAGVTVSLNDRRWGPERAKLVVYEGPAIPTEELGLGRGWGNVTRGGENVTEVLLAQAQGEAGARAGAQAAGEPQAGGASPEAPGGAGQAPPSLERLKELIVAQGSTLELRQVVELAAQLSLGARASERLSLAEQAIWELLHEGRVTLVRGQQPLPRERWQAVLLDWATWTDAGPDGVGVTV